MGQNSVGGSAKPGIRNDWRIVLCMFKDKAEAKKQSRTWKKREDVNRADLPNRYEQQGRYFFFFFFRSPAVKNECVVCFLLFFSNASTGGEGECMVRTHGENRRNGGMERRREVESLGNTSD